MGGPGGVKGDLRVDFDKWCAAVVDADVAYGLDVLVRVEFGDLAPVVVVW